MKNTFKFFPSLFNKSVLTISLLAVSGISFLVGVFVFVFSDLSFDFFSFFISDYLSRKSSPFLRVLFSSLISNSMCIMPVFLSAMSVFGFILPYIVLSYYSFSIGLAASFLYGTYKFSGILYFITVLLPDIFVFFLCLFSASHIAISKTYALFFSKRDTNFRNSFISFVKSFLIIFIFTFLSSAISAGAAFLFANLFNF